jgi:hypothetical protein
VDDDAEVIDGLPVVAEPVAVEVVRPGYVPARQAAALVATSFVAGAATAAMLTRRRSVLRRRRRSGRVGALGDVVASNTFLVDVHLLRR